jgi:hypothetical protein
MQTFRYLPTLPKICSKPPRTRRGAQRQYDAIVRAYKRAFAGGGMFGWDGPTFRANWPEGYQRAQDIAALWRKLEG